VVNNTIGEIADYLHEDTLAFYLKLLGDQKDIKIKLPLNGSRGEVICDTQRLKNVLLKTAEIANWDNQKNKNSVLGIACAYYKTSYAAHIVEVENNNNKIRLKKIVAVLDCGKVINPLGVRAQMEGAISDAITVTLKSNITIEQGQPQEINFDTHPVIRISDMPELHLHIMDSDEPPSGAGEPPFPSVAPAIANAIFKLTGEKIRKLPISI